MRTIATGKLGRVVFAHLAPGDDLYKAVLEIAKEQSIHTGVILDMTGAASQVRLSLPTRETPANKPAQVITEVGLVEFIGSGVIGQTKVDFVNGDGEVRYNAGDPYLHLHLTATVNGKTYTGHLIEGTLVRSVIPQSHCTIAIAAVEGIELDLLLDTDCTDDYPSGVLYHDLRQVDLN